MYNLTSKKIDKLYELTKTPAISIISIYDSKIFDRTFDLSITRSKPSALTSPGQLKRKYNNYIFYK